MKAVLQFVLSVVLLTLSANAADLAILRNGNSIRHERREVVGPVTRLYLSSSGSGYIEIPTDQIERFERDTTPAPVAPAATQSAPAPVLNSLKPAVPATAATRAELNDMVAGAGARHQIDPDFLNSVIRAESGFHQHAVSKKGAQGLMQLMPGTASELGVSNPFDAGANVEGGTRYLRELLEKYNNDPVKALAAYNAGAGRVDKYHGVPPYYETQAYIARIIKDFNRQKIAKNPSLAKKAKPANSRATKSSAVKRPSPRTKAAASPAEAKQTGATKTAIATSIPPQATP